MKKKQNKDIPEGISIRNKFSIEKAIDKYLNDKDNIEIDGIELKDMFKVEINENIPDMYPRLILTIPVDKNKIFLKEFLNTFLTYL